MVGIKGHVVRSYQQWRLSGRASALLTYSTVSVLPVWWKGTETNQNQQLFEEKKKILIFDLNLLTWSLLEQLPLKISKSSNLKRTSMRKWLGSILEAAICGWPEHVINMNIFLLILELYYIFYHYYFYNIHFIHTFMIVCTYLQHHNILIKHFIPALYILIVIHLTTEPTNISQS